MSCKVLLCNQCHAAISPAMAPNKIDIVIRIMTPLNVIFIFYGSPLLFAWKKEAALYDLSQMYISK